MSAAKRRREEEEGNLAGSKKQLFADVETDAPVVCAIDFGTARTGIAYAFTKSVASEIKVKEPGGQEPGKTHTSLLLDQHERFLAFGSKAREDYYECDETGLLFETFKMRLHDTHAGSFPVAAALNGKKVSLLKLFTHSLSYLKEDAMAEINRSQVNVLRPNEIKWVLTVPAIWRDAAKGMMRKAAYDAGMISGENSSKLVLCLEPEAACMACEDERLADPSAVGNQILKTNDTFMVLDCGGGTVDITMHRVEGTKPLQLSEIREPSGGPWGSTYVDAAYERFVQTLIGDAAWKRFKPSSAWVDLMRAWEDTKLNFDPSEHSDDACTPVRINLAALVGDDVLGDRTLKNCVDAYNSAYGGNITLRRGTTIMMPLLQVNTFFQQVIGKIVTHVGELLAKNPVNYIYLVGGFAESKMLQKRVKVAFETQGLHVIVPMRPQLMVVKGAVLFGLRKGSTIQSRLARYTYGFESSRVYDANDVEHQTRPVRTTKGGGVVVKYITGRFDSLVQRGSKISVSQKVEGPDRVPLSDDQTKVTYKLYSSDSTNAKWVDGMTEIGEVSVPSTYGQKSRVAMSFGNTEITATATNQVTGVLTNATIKYNFNTL